MWFNEDTVQVKREQPTGNVDDFDQDVTTLQIVDTFSAKFFQGVSSDTNTEIRVSIDTHATLYVSNHDINIDKRDKIFVRNVEWEIEGTPKKTNFDGLDYTKLLQIIIKRTD